VSPSNRARISVSRGFEVGQVSVNPRIQSLTLFLKTPPKVDKPEAESKPISVLSIKLEFVGGFHLTYMRTELRFGFGFPAMNQYSPATFAMDEGVTEKGCLSEIYLFRANQIVQRQKGKKVEAGMR